MPPGRPRKSAGSTTSSRATPSAAAQSTLSFNSKAARVTKPSITNTSTKKEALKIPEAALVEAIEDAEPENTNVELEPEETVQVPLRQPQQPVKPAVSETDEVEEKAQKISDAQLKRYWKAEEDKRKAPRGMLKYLMSPVPHSDHWHSNSSQQILYVARIKSGLPINI